MTDGSIVATGCMPGDRPGLKVAAVVEIGFGGCVLLITGTLSAANAGWQTIQSIKMAIAMIAIDDSTFSMLGVPLTMKTHLIH